ncbi:GIY-YIG nuclease family protein [Thermoactinomyces mirandus]|uniref:GIY-YIG nuclease family protein n=1 Tax=Thermoactinomyces mirandus TaxID=2756294 RepID=A0A7W1XQ76_9BACL|nr:GIY-YIG nuclease family protein [Thermoactinomyces mirandus]MBA4601229.1 GIY-YIG nuclease family protein [Thermoactinomyces mirandus]
MADTYVVYILECGDGSLYTGMTNNLKQRVKMHQAGKGAKYTRGRLPVRLRYVEMGEGKSWALRREREIKRLPRQKKRQLIREGEIPDGEAEKLCE